MCISALDREQLLERAAGLFEDRAAGVGQTVLRQVADRQRRRLENRPAVGLVEPRHHLEQGGLAGAVRAAEADALAIGDLPGDVVQQDTVAERLGELRQLDHAERNYLFYQLGACQDRERVEG